MVTIWLPLLFLQRIFRKDFHFASRKQISTGSHLSEAQAVAKASVSSLLEFSQAHSKWPYEGFSRLPDMPRLNHKLDPIRTPLEVSTVPFLS